MTTRRNSYSLAIGAVLFAVFCWGLAPVATRYLLTVITPVQLVLARYCLSALLFLPVLVVLKQQSWSRRDLGYAFLCGLANIIGYNLCVTYGLQRIPAGMASIIIATEPIWMALISLLVFRERSHWVVWLGFAGSLVGMALLIGGNAGGFSATTLLGAGFTLFATVMWGVYSLALRPISKKYGAPTSTGITVIFGTVPLLAFFQPVIVGRIIMLSRVEWLALLFLVVGSTVLAMILWNYALLHVPGTTAGLFMYLVPCVGVAGGVLFLGEPLAANTLLGGFLIIAGVAIAQTPQFFQRKQAASTPREDAFAR